MVTVGSGDTSIPSEAINLESNVDRLLYSSRYNNASECYDFLNKEKSYKVESYNYHEGDKFNKLLDPTFSESIVNESYKKSDAGINSKIDSISFENSQCKTRYELKKSIEETIDDYFNSKSFEKKK